MERVIFASTCVLCLALVAGCGNSESTTVVADGSSTGSASQPGSAQQGTPTLQSGKGPMAETARGFLEAVIAGDTQRATSLLTPLAVKQIEESGKAFAPPGLETADFRIGEVLNVAPTQSFVQCYLTNGSGVEQTKEEMCCVVKEVDGRWLVSGIAFQLDPNRPPFILDFEKPVNTGPTQQMVGQPPFGQQSSPAAQTPRTAAESGYPVAR